MQESDFTENKPGRLVRTLSGHWAFAPNVLPPALRLNWSLVHLLSKADRALGELAGLGRTLPNPYLLIRPFIRREAVLSSKIEGTQASLSDLVLFEISRGTPSRSQSLPDDVREVSNYVTALETGLDRVNQLPLSLRLLRELHNLLMAGVRGGQFTPGEFRRVQNWIGPPESPIENASYVPPPVDEMNAALHAFEAFLHSKQEIPPLIRLALVHYQFEAIHPFLDRNGRIGRLLLSLTLCLEKLLPHPLLYLSAYFEKHRTQYYQRLLDVSQKGKWEEWIAFFLDGVAEQSLDAIWRAGELLRLRVKFRNTLPSARASTLLLRMVDDLFDYPAVTIQHTAKHLEITARAAGLNIAKLQNAGILEETTGRERYRTFACRPILEVIDMERPSPTDPSQLDQSAERLGTNALLEKRDLPIQSQ